MQPSCSQLRQTAIYVWYSSAARLRQQRCQGDTTRSGQNPRGRTDQVPAERDAWSDVDLPHVTSRLTDWLTDQVPAERDTW